MTEIRIRRHLPLTTRDGLTLPADLYLPPGAGPFPTLLYRVRGDRDSAFIVGTLMLNPVVAAEKGYAVVVQQVRGRKTAEGEWHPFVHEASDGTDALEWVLDQPWCNGAVGVYGSAYAGATALLLAAEGHPAVRACVAFVTGADYHDGWIYTSGALELGWDNFWGYLTAGESLARLDLPPAEHAARFAALADAMKQPRAQMERLPLRDQPALEGLSPHYQTWLDHPTYDDYWKAIDVIARADRIAAPVLSITGWWDNFLGSHLQLYEALAGRSPSGEHQRLVIGPWDHFTYVGVVPTTAGDRNFGPLGLAGNPVVGPWTLDWFDRWLGDGRETETTQSGVRYFVPGADEWRVADAWPPPHSPTPFYFHSLGSAAGSDGDGLLSTTAPAPEPADRYQYDPTDPTPTVGGRTLMPTVVDAGIRDQGSMAARRDVLCYTTQALEKPIEIAGPVVVELWASSSAEDTDFAAKLVDVFPDGYAAMVADGIVRARYRTSRETAEYLAPGEVVHYEIDLWAVAWTFEAGHRIRVEIASANFPRFDRNLNVRGTLADLTLEDAVVAEQTVYHDTDRPSHIVLPITRQASSAPGES
jgi:putative CocE/NonD family hydrolase